MDQTILIAVDQSQHDILVAANRVQQLTIISPQIRLGNIEQNRRGSRIRGRARALIKEGLLELVSNPHGRFVVRITLRGMQKVGGL